MVIYIFGAGGQGTWAEEVARAQGFEPVMVDRDHEPEILSGEPGAFAHVAIGDNFLRQRVTRRVQAAWPQAQWPALIHPRAVVSPSATLGDGCLVLANAVIGPDAVLGDGVSVWTNAVLEHHAQAGAFASLAPGALTGGGSRLGARSFLGLNATVKHQVSIGDDIVVGCGALVIDDLIGPCIAIGVPARALRVRQPHEAYL